MILQAPPSSNFALEAGMLQIGWFYLPKWKLSKNQHQKIKHPIKLHFSIWSLQSDNPEKNHFQKNLHLNHILYQNPKNKLAFSWTFQTCFSSLWGKNGFFGYDPSACFSGITFFSGLSFWKCQFEKRSLIGCLIFWCWFLESFHFGR